MVPHSYTYTPDSIFALVEGQYAYLSGDQIRFERIACDVAPTAVSIKVTMGPVLSYDPDARWITYTISAVD